MTKLSANEKKMERVEDDPLLQANRNVSEHSIKDNKQISKELFANLYTTKHALITQGGFLVIVLSLYYCLFTSPIMLFTGHPLFNSLGLLGLGQGILLVQPTPRSADHKSLQGHVHGIINSISVLMFTIGSTIIFVNKSIHGAKHITSWHATFGVITYSCMILVMLVGMSMYWFGEKVFGSVDQAKSFYKYHRLAGYFILLLSSITVTLATDSDFNHNVMHLSPLVVGIGLLMVVYGIFTQIQPQKIKL